MSKLEEKKKVGRPPLPMEKRRTAMLSMRTYPEIEAKAKRVGTVAIEDAIRKIKEISGSENDEI